MSTQLSFHNFSLSLVTQPATPGRPARQVKKYRYTVQYTVYMVELRIKIFFNQDEDGLLGSGTYLNLKLVLNDKK